MTDLKIIHFDMEAKPGHWIGGDYVSKIITAVAWSFAGQKKVHVLTHYGLTPGALAERMAYEIRNADIVTGHYIRGFDLPLLNGTLLDYGMEPLPTLTTSDTKEDVLKQHGRSLSQKNLSAMLDLPEPKMDVTLREWERFNSVEPGWEEAGAKRVRLDVVQHKALRQGLLDIGWLGPVRTWSPGGKKSGKYRP